MNLDFLDGISWNIIVIGALAMVSGIEWLKKLFEKIKFEIPGFIYHLALPVISFAAAFFVAFSSGGWPVVSVYALAFFAVSFLGYPVLLKLPEKMINKISGGKE